MKHLLIVLLLWVSIAGAYPQSLHFDLRQYTQEYSVFSFTERDEWPQGGYVQITRSVRIHPTKQNGRYRLELTFGRHEFSSNFMDGSKQLKSELFLNDYISKCKLLLNLSDSYLVESTNAQQLAEELKPKYQVFREANQEDILLKSNSADKMAWEFLETLGRLVGALSGGILYNMDLSEGTLQYERDVSTFTIKGQVELQKTDSGYGLIGKLLALDTDGRSGSMDLEWEFDTSKRLIRMITTLGYGSDIDRKTTTTLTRSP